MRFGYALRDKHRLGEDRCAKLRLERCGRHQLDAFAEALAKLALQTSKLEEGDWPLELDDVALFSGFITSKPANERQARNAKLLSSD